MQTRRTYGGGVFGGSLFGYGLGSARLMLNPNATTGTTGAAPAAPAGQAAPPAAPAQAAPAAPAQIQQAVGGGAQPPAAPAGFDGLIAAIGQAVGQAMGPLQQQAQQQTAAMNTLHQTLQGMAQPQNPRAAGMVSGTAAQPGAAHGIRQGENIMGSRGFSFLQALRYSGGHIEATQAKMEGELSARLYQAYGQNNPMFEHGRGAILVPVAAEHIPDDALADECRQMTQASVAGLHMGNIRQAANMARMGAGRFGNNPELQQALGIFDDTQMGIFLDSAMQGELIPLLRAQEIFSRAGATEITLPINGRLPMGRHVGAVNAYWVGQGAAGNSNRGITASNPTTGKQGMIAKKLGVLVRIPNDLIRFSSRSVELFIRQDIAMVAALEESSTFLKAAGTDLQPKGLTAYSGIETVLASTVGTDGNTVEPEDMDALCAEIEENEIDVSNFTLVMRPKMRSALANRRADAVTAGDGKGPFVFLDMAVNATMGNRKTIRGYNVITSTQVPNNLTKGSSGATLTQIIGGVFQHAIIGRHGVMEFATANQGTDEFTRDETLLRAIEYVDFMPRYEEAFGMITSLIVG